MKGYRLKDLETKKLITVRDVCFVEDVWPCDLAIVDSGSTSSGSSTRLMEIQPDGSHQALPPAKKENSPTIEVTAPPPAPVPHINTKKPEVEAAAAAPDPEDTTPPTSPLTPPPADTPPAAPESAPKTNCWVYLPPWGHPTRVRIAAQ